MNKKKITPVRYVQNTINKARKENIKNMNDIEVLNGGYALYFTIGDKAYVIGNMSINNPFDLREVTQDAVNKHKEEWDQYCDSPQDIISGYASDAAVIPFVNNCIKITGKAARQILEQLGYTAESLYNSYYMHMSEEGRPEHMKRLGFTDQDLEAIASK